MSVLLFSVCSVLSEESVCVFFCGCIRERKQIRMCGLFMLYTLTPMIGGCPVSHELQLFPHIQFVNILCARFFCVCVLRSFRNVLFADARFSWQIDSSNENTYGSYFICAHARIDI